MKWVHHCHFIDETEVFLKIGDFLEAAIKKGYLLLLQEWGETLDQTFHCIFDELLIDVFGFLQVVFFVKIGYTFSDLREDSFQFFWVVLNFVQEVIGVNFFALIFVYESLEGSVGWVGPGFLNERKWLFLIFDLIVDQNEQSYCRIGCFDKNWLKLPLYVLALMVFFADKKFVSYG